MDSLTLVAELSKGFVVNCYMLLCLLADMVWGAQENNGYCVNSGDVPDGIVAHQVPNSQDAFLHSSTARDEEFQTVGSWGFEDSFTDYDCLLELAILAEKGLTQEVPSCLGQQLGVRMGRTLENESLKIKSKKGKKKRKVR